jgi:acyl carrier protein
MKTRFLTLGEVAELLRVDEMTVYRMVKKGAIPAMRIGHQWRFDEELIKEWLRIGNIALSRPLDAQKKLLKNPVKKAVALKKKASSAQDERRRTERRKAAERRAAERRKNERRMQERRKFVRLARGLPVQLALGEKGKAALKATTRDISEGGLALEGIKDNLPQTLSRRKTILTIDVPELNSQLKISAEVVWQRLSKDKGAALGMRFVELDKQARENLQSYLGGRWQAEKLRTSEKESRTKIKAIIAKIARRDASEFDESTNIREELGIDSLQAMEIMAAIETHFKITIDELKALSIVSVGDLLNLMQEALGNQVEVKVA